MIIGPLLKTIIDDLSRKAANGLMNRTFHIYSGHDAVMNLQFAYHHYFVYRVRINHK